jgi:hypothetical protein
VCSISTSAGCRAIDSFHPDLRRPARFLPRAVVGPRTLGPIRRLTSLTARRRRPKGVEVLGLGDIEVRVQRPGSSAPDRRRPALLWVT